MVKHIHTDKDMHHIYAPLYKRMTTRCLPLILWWSPYTFHFSAAGPNGAINLSTTKPPLKGNKTKLSNQFCLSFFVSFWSGGRKPFAASVSFPCCTFRWKPLKYPAKNKTDESYVHNLNKMSRESYCSTSQFMAYLCNKPIYQLVGHHH